MLIIDKTNQEGKAQYGVAFRNKEVQYCPVGGVALWIFYRYYVMNEPWPNFMYPDVWYYTKLLSKIKGEPHEELSSYSHREACDTAYAKAKCQYLHGTHEGRREGCKRADMLNVPDAQMRRLGQWDSSRMTKHYSSGLPRQGARILGGHGPTAGIECRFKM